MGLRFVGCVAVALLSFGCASTPKSIILPPPPLSAHVRDAFRGVAVQVTVESAPVGAEKPPAGALAGAGVGLAGGAEAGLQFADESGRGLAQSELGVLVWAAANAVVFPVCLIGGTVYGSIASMSEDELRTRMAVLESAFELAGPTLGLSEELAAAFARDGAAPTGAADATLAVRVARRGLFGKSGMDPETYVVVEIAAELRLADGSSVYRATFVHIGATRAFTAWTADADAIRAEIRVAVRRLAERVADEIVLVEWNIRR